MKNRILIILSLLLIAAIPAAAKKKNASQGDAKPVFVEKVYDFGVIKEKNGPVAHDFVFENRGDGNYIILDATAECGCTRPEYPKDPIAPGKKGKVKVTFNPAGRVGPFEKTVTVKGNSMPRKVRLKIRGVVR